MRNKKDVDNSNRHNETKALILFTLVKSKKYLYISDIAKELGISNNNAARQMTKLCRRQWQPYKRKQQAYVHRRKQRFGSHKGEYMYRFLKQKGRRVCKELWIRTKLREIDTSVTLNLKKMKMTPIKLAKQRQEFEIEYNQWLQE